MEVLLQLVISDPVEVEPGRFETTLTHPSLTGALVLSHGLDRDTLLKAVSVDFKQIDPVATLFRNLVELRDSV